jgi:recombination protein RecA
MPKKTQDQPSEEPIPPVQAVVDLNNKPKKKGKKGEDGEDDSQPESREDKLAELFRVTKKKYGSDAVIYAKDFRIKDIPRISTGILPLDYGLGGGVPVGRITAFWGYKSSSKTTTILRTIGNAQRMCSECWTEIKNLPPKKEGATPERSCVCGKNRKTIVSWIDVEGVWDNRWAARFCDRDELLFSQPDTAEQTIDLADAQLRSGAVDIIVIDSIAFMTSQQEIDKSADEMTVGVQARLVGQQMRKFVSGTNMISRTEGRRPTVIFTNQMRNKVGVMFGSPETQSGGLAHGFATSIEVRCKVSGKYQMDDETGKPLSVPLSFVVEKNKTAGAKMEGEYAMALCKTEVKNIGDIIDETWAIKMGEQTGLIDRASPSSLTWNGRNFHGVSSLAKHWAVDREDYALFKSQLMPVLLEI